MRSEVKDDEEEDNEENTWLPVNNQLWIKSASEDEYLKISRRGPPS